MARPQVVSESLDRIRRAAVPSGRGPAREVFTGRATELAGLMRLQAGLRGVDVATLSPVAASRALRVHDALVGTSRPRSPGDNLGKQVEYIGASLLRREYVSWHEVATMFGERDDPVGRDTTKLLIEAAREACVLDELILSLVAMSDRYVPLITVCSTLRDVIEREFA